MRQQGTRKTLFENLVGLLWVDDVFRDAALSVVSVSQSCQHLPLMVSLPTMLYLVQLHQQNLLNFCESMWYVLFIVPHLLLI